MDQDISLKTEKGRFNYRVAGVVFHRNRILLLTEDRFDFWYLPGGKANLFETSEEALRREIFEEFAENPVIERVLWTTECIYYFEAWDIKHHDLTFYYLIRFPEKASIYSTDSGTAMEAFSNEKTNLHYRWFDMDKIDEINLVPKFLKSALKNIPTHIEHVIIKELPQEKLHD